MQTDPQKFLSLCYNRSTLHPENHQDLALVEAEQLYEKMLGNMTNKVVTNLNDNVSYQPSFAQQEVCGEQAFHPNFDRIENNSNNNTTNNQVS